MNLIKGNFFSKGCYLDGKEEPEKTKSKGDNSKGCYLDRKKSQDKRIRNTKLEKGKERKLRRKENKDMSLIVNIEESVRAALVPNLSGV